MDTDTTPPPRPLRPIGCVHLAALAALVLFVVHVGATWYGCASGVPLFFFTQMLLTLAIPIAVLSLAYRIAGLGRDPAPRKGIFEECLLAAVVGLPLIGSLSPVMLFVGDLGTRHRVDSLSDEAELQAWAERILKMPQSDLPLAGIRRRRNPPPAIELDRHRLPAFVRLIGGNDDYVSTVYIYEEASRRYVVIDAWGGRPHAWGVAAGAKDWVPRRNGRWWTRRWRPGLYGWQGINEVS